MAMRKKFLEVYRQFGHASSKSFASPAVDSFFRKSPQQEIRYCESRRPLWPKPTSDHASIDAVLQEFFAILAFALIFQKNNNPFLSLAAEEWMSQHFVTAFVSKCLFTQGCLPQFYFEAFAPITKLSQMQRFFMHFAWVFSTPYFTVCTISVSTPGQPYFIRRQQIVKQIKSFTHITTKSIAILNSFNCVTDLKMIHWLESKRP